MKVAAEIAKSFVEEAKREVKEKERLQRMYAKFADLFGFLPDYVQWTKESGKAILEAIAEINLDEKVSILGEKVEVVKFHIKEDPWNGEGNIDWEFSQFTRGEQTVYKFRKRMKEYFAFIEIITE